MRKLQIFAYKSGGTFRLGLLRTAQSLADLDLPEGGQVRLLTPPLPSFQAYQVLELWKQRLKGFRGRLWWRLAGQAPDPFEACSGYGGDLKDLSSCLTRILAGRMLSERKVIQLLREQGFWPHQISRALDAAVFQGSILQFPGFTAASWGRCICSRCGGEDAQVLPCLNCGSRECLLCSACLTMGEHRACSTLLAAPGQAGGAAGRVELVLDYELTPAQHAAAGELIQFWEGEGPSALVWAACGAGKTEVTFPLIQRALEEGWEVLFAIPRQDIVREVVDRLSRAFPKVPVAAHYAGQPPLAQGRLVVATTHQVLQFYRRFRLVILDEVDAFPYQGNEQLRFGLRRALAEGGRLVEMTATPGGKLGYSKVITIPARYHGFPLPEPEIITTELPPWSQLCAEDLPQLVVDHLQSCGQWLVFAPTVSACEEICRTLREVLGSQVGFCHSKVGERRQTIEAFRSGRLRVLVSTSVLERGVNFPGVQVMVLYADHSIFSTSALVQMAGRVGRTAEAPSGLVLFVAARRSHEMRRAQALIRELNAAARERGLLHAEGTA